MAHHHSSDRPRRSDGNRRNNNQRNRRPRHRDGEGRENRPQRRENPDYEFIPGRELRAEAKAEKNPRKPAAKPSSAKPSFGRRLLGLLTFGLMGKSKTAPGKRPHQPPPMRTTISKSSAQGSQRPPRGPRQERNGGDATRGPSAQRDRSPRPVDLQTITSPKLHIGNLSYDTSEGDLFELFNGIGKVSNAEIVTHKKTQKSKGFGFVHMGSIDEAKRAVEVLHGKPFMGRIMTVGPARGDGPRDRDNRVGDDDGDRGSEREDEFPAEPRATGSDAV